ncbi:MAG: aspartate aminotransferase family protein [Candidatus Bathyarchaeia archaeon]
MTIESNHTSKTIVKRPVIIVGGRGAVVWDPQGKEYIDCIGGHGVCNVGHCHPKVIEAIEKQVRRLIHIPDSLYNDARATFLQKLIGITPGELTSVFLTNSGTESVECALKIARRYTGKHGIIATIRGFHGRTLGSLSATWKPEYRKPFEPLVPGFTHVKFGDVGSIEEVISEDTAAVIIEPVQGEGGVHIAPNGYLKGVREICDDHGILLIFDEIQTGFGRTGKMFALEHWGIVPDILCLAKGIAGGFPMGATVAKEEVMDSLRPLEHGNTFGGNPLACAAATASIDAIIEEKLAERAAKLGRKLLRDLSTLQKEHELIREVRGLGLMIGVELRVPVKDAVRSATERGLLVLSAGLNVIRLLPPLVITENQLDRAITILGECIEMLESERRPG